MSLDAAFTRNDGSANVPGIDSPWDAWVAASRTYHFCCDDPLLDWLEAHGESRGFARDDETSDPRTEFRPFIFEKGRRFEAAVVDHLSRSCRLVTIRQDAADTQNRARVEATWQAMRDGVEVIAQGVLWDAEQLVYGAPDLLVRSDVLRRLVPDAIAEGDAARPAPDLDAPDWHYRVVDVKFTTLELLRDGHAGAKHLNYMVQVWLYNEALGRLQGWTPDTGYLLGRRWKEGPSSRGHGALERLARVGRDRDLNAATLSATAREAVRWVRRVRAEGATWSVLPAPSVPELRPNMRHTEDQPWHRAKARIAAQLEDVTLLPRVTPGRRSLALAGGVDRWTDRRCSATLFGFSGSAHEATVNAILAANHAADGEGPVFPARVTASEDCWRVPAAAEFYVDFETVSDLDDDFSTFPDAGGQPLVFMIGCGQWTGPADRPEWTHRVFTATSLTPAEERRIIEAWLAHLREATGARGATIAEARLFHWSPAETSTLITAYNSACARHSQPSWMGLPWVDLLGRVVKRQPVTVRGAFAFGLKAIARAMHAHGLIDTLWRDSATDGLGAMVGAFWCHHEAASRGVPMTSLDLMREIEAYNEVDCRVMAEVLAYLRAHR
jgi:predicted RecB family nuclease